MNQNHTAIVSQQLSEVIYPALNDQYSFRQDMKGQQWFMSSRSSDSVFALRFAAESAEWVVRAVIGTESERHTIETMVRKLCTQKA